MESIALWNSLLSTSWALAHFCFCLSLLGRLFCGNAAFGMSLRQSSAWHGKHLRSRLGVFLFGRLLIIALVAQIARVFEFIVGQALTLYAQYRYARYSSY